MIDLRSDTVTRPSDAMREAMADAEVGDDVYGESNRTSEAPFDERLRPRETRSAVDLASRCVLRDRGGHGVAADPSEDHVPSVSTLRWIGRVEPSTT